MQDNETVTMVTTADTDVHLIPSDIDTTRMKCERVKWLLTTDGRYVNTASIVSIWKPTDEELAGFLGSGSAGEF